MIDSQSNTHGSHAAPVISLVELYQGFQPAFRDLSTDETHLSIDDNGEPASMHLLDNVPIEWVIEWDERGYPLALKEGVIAGFIRAGEFLSVAQLQRRASDA